MSAENATELNTILNPEQDMKPADQFTQNKMRLFRRGKTGVKVLPCTFGDTILFAFCVKGLLYNQELQM